MLSVNILYKKNGLFAEWYKNGTDWYSVPGERNVPKWYYFIRGILFFQLNSCPSGRLSIATLPTTVTQKIDSFPTVKSKFRHDFNIHRNQAVSTHRTISCWLNALRTRYANK